MALNRVEKTFIITLALLVPPWLFCNVVVIVMVLTGTDRW